MKPEELAVALGISLLQVYEWEAGTRSIEAEHLPEIIRVLGVVPEFFSADRSPRTLP